MSSRNSPLLMADEAAAYLRVTRKTLYRWIEAGELPVIRFRRRVRFREADLERWVEERASNVKLKAGLRK